MFDSILTGVQGSLSIQQALFCTLTSLVLGFIISCIYMLLGNFNKNFVITLTLLPAIVQLVIMMVNGNVGTGVAVLGAFSLVRFRSVPGSSKEIVSIFFSMSVGLATGMGYLSFAVLIVFSVGLVFLILGKTPYGEQRVKEKDLRITIAENLDYTEIFDDIFAKYTKKYSLCRVKTINLGSLYELNYHILLKSEKEEKEMIDAIRCRNGNLTIICGRISSLSEETL